MQFDLVFSNVERRGVWQRAFQTVTDLNKHLSILHEHEENDTVALLFLTDAPRLRHAPCVVGDIGITLHFRKNRYDNLIGGFALKLRELLVKPERRLLRNDSSIIVKIARRFWRNNFGAVRGDNKKNERKGDKVDRALCGRC